MKTLIYDLKNEENINEVLAQASYVINSGGLVVFPTETVYGLGANALDNEAVKKIFIAKNRPNDNPLIVHISSFDMMEDLVKNVSEDARKLMEAFFPGPLTLIMEKTEKIPMNVSNGLDTVGIRMPSDKHANMFIESCGCPIAAPSANISKRPSITNKEYLIEELSGKVDIILCDEDSKIGLESTVLDVSHGNLKLLRPGKISVEDIEHITGKKVSGFDKEDVLLPKSPGMKYEHYAPKTKVVVIDGNEFDIVDFLCKISNEKKVGILGLTTLINKIDSGKISAISFGDNVNMASKHLYSYLRQMDKLNLDIIYVQKMSTKGIGLAFMNRLMKASKGDITIV